MTFLKYVLILFLGGFFLWACTDSLPHTQSEQAYPDSVSKSENVKLHVTKEGKIPALPLKEKPYDLDALDSFNLPVINGDVVNALNEQLKLLRVYRQKKYHQLGAHELTVEDMTKVVLLLKEWEYAYPLGLKNQLEGLQLSGVDGRGHVQFTGYFTPIIKVRSRPGKKYKYPLYKRPRNWIGAYPTRRQIDGAEQFLSGRNLEVAYAANPVSVYYMQVQGSGFVQYENGRTTYLAYDGTNRHPYRSIGQYLAKTGLMGRGGDISIKGIDRFIKKNPHLADSILFQNPSYTFFTPKGNKPLGAATVPLTANYSIAVDTRYIPLGSVLLAAVPQRDTSGNIYHEMRLLFAQDKGGAIKGPGHVDVYCGIGREAQQRASDLNHYGRLWILRPKPQT